MTFTLPILAHVRWLAVCLLVVLVAACGGDEPAPAEEPGSGDVPATVTGVIVEVQPAEGDVESFVVEQDGTRYTLLIADDVDYGFDLGHLREHMSLAEPVAVSTEQRDDGAYALSIEDV